MKKYVSLLFLYLCIVFTLVGCSSGYNEDDFIGKTSSEIISEFGSFDCVFAPADEDGVYRNCKCGYTIKEAKKGFLGKSEEVLLFIVLDENGVAIECREGNRPGG